MFRKFLWLIFAIGISGAFIYGFEAFLMVAYMDLVSSFVETAQNSASGGQDRIDPFSGGIMTGALFAAKGFSALLGIKVASIIF